VRSNGHAPLGSSASAAAWGEVLKASGKSEGNGAGGAGLGSLFALSCSGALAFIFFFAAANFPATDFAAAAARFSALSLCCCGTATGLAKMSAAKRAAAPTSVGNGGGSGNAVS